MLKLKVICKSQKYNFLFFNKIIKNIILIFNTYLLFILHGSS